MTAHRFTLPSDAATPREARSRLRSILERHVVDPTAIATLELLASEVVTNVVIHTDCPDFDVELDVGPDAVRVCVTDCDVDHLPVLLPRDDERFWGRGIQIVDATARRWGYEVDGSHKTVWFEVVSHAVV